MNEMVWDERDRRGAAYDAAVRAVVDDTRELARIEGRRTRHLAAAVAAADSLAALDAPGGSGGSGGSLANTVSGSPREWARRSLAAEIACTTRQPERTVARLLNESEILTIDLPGTVAALEAGSIAYAHARVLCAHVGSLPAEAVPAFEATVLPLAATETAARLDDRARRLRESLHPESIAVRARRAADDRAVWFDAERDGMATIHHHLPAVDAVAIHDLVDRTSRALRADDDPRTHAQRCSDVLADLTLGRADGARRLTPTVIVTVPAAALTGAPGEVVARTGAAPGAGAHGGPHGHSAHGELHGYGAIDADACRRIAVAASTVLVATVDDTTGDLRAVGRARYRPSATLRTLLQLDDETCRFPGCRRAAERCELDHTEAWADGGTTTPDNLAHLCPGHHHLKHEGGWHVTPTRDGTRTLHWISPRGTPHTTRPTGRSARLVPPVTSPPHPRGGPPLRRIPRFHELPPHPVDESSPPRAGTAPIALRTPTAPPRVRATTVRDSITHLAGGLLRVPGIADDPPPF